MQNEIEKILTNSTTGLTVSQIAQSIQLNRNSTAKYLDIMKSQEKVILRKVGPAKLYVLSNKPALSIQLQLFKHAMDAASCGITIADAKSSLYPLVYVNEKFLSITGYTREEVLGQNCRFLQGETTDKRARSKIRKALANNTRCEVVIDNYTKSGKHFLNKLHLAPVKNDDGEVTHFIGIQTT